MRKVLLAILITGFLLPVLAYAVPESCPDCILGIYDDQALTKCYGTNTPNVPKDIYVGVDLPAQYGGLTGIEYSVSGFGDGILVLSADPISPATPLGSISAPADTSESTAGTGGQNVAWSSCQAIAESRLALIKVSILSFTAVTDRVFVVKHKYPVSNPSWKTAIFTKCDAPDYTAVRVFNTKCASAGRYVLNPSGTNPECCTTAVTSSTWSGVKGLYK